MFESRFSLFEKLLKKTLIFFFNLLELKSGKYSHYYVTNSTAFTNNLLISFKFLSFKNLKQRWLQTIIGCKCGLAGAIWSQFNWIHLVTIMNGYVYFMSHHRRKTTQTKWMASIPWKKNVNATNKIKTHTIQTNIKKISRARFRFTTM